MLFRTKESCYLYSKKHNKIILLHPILVYIIQQEENLPNINNEVNNAYSRQEISYYYKKYRLLKENGYFDRIDAEEETAGRYTGKDIRNHLYNNRQLAFETTDKCNLRCSYCYYGDLYCGYSHREKHYLSEKKARNLFDYMVGFWNSPENHSCDREIRIGFYGGEPLLNFPFIKKMVQYAQKTRLKHNYFTYGLTTNGTLLDKHMEYLVENNFHILVSLDGDEKSNGFRVFQNGSPIYETVYHNIEKLLGRFPGYFEKYVNFAAVLHRLNSLEGIYNYFKTNFNKTPRITEVSFSGVKDSAKDTVAKMFVSKTDSFKQVKNRKKIQSNLKLSVPPVTALTALLCQYSDDTFKNLEDLLITHRKSKIPTGSCIPLNRRIFLTTDGSILPCERVAHHHTMGRVTEEKVEIDFDKIAEKYNLLFDRLANQCRQCSSVRDCQNCVLQMETQVKDCPCPAFKDQNQFEKFLSETVAFLEGNPGLYKRIGKELFLE